MLEVDLDGSASFDGLQGQICLPSICALAPKKGSACVEYQKETEGGARAQMPWLLGQRHHDYPVRVIKTTHSMSPWLLTVSSFSSKWSEIKDQCLKECLSHNGHKRHPFDE